MTTAHDTCVRFAVVLTCGQSIWFRAAHHLPRAGESMPCPRHTYCRVAHVGRADRPRADAASSLRGRRRPGRSVAQLLSHLENAPGANTFPTLLRAGFTLRLVREAERAGEIEVDWINECCTQAS